MQDIFLLWVMCSLDNKHILPKGILKTINELLKKSLIYEIYINKAQYSSQRNSKKKPNCSLVFPFCKKITQPARMQMFVAVQCYYLSAWILGRGVGQGAWREAAEPWAWQISL